MNIMFGGPGFGNESWMGASHVTIVIKGQSFLITENVVQNRIEVRLVDPFMSELQVIPQSGNVVDLKAVKA